MSKLKLIRILLAILLVLWMAVIYFMSAQAANQSSQISGGLVEKIVEIFYRDFDDLDKTSRDEVINLVTVIVRKSAHFLEYFILGLIAFAIALTYDKKLIILAFGVLFFCVVYAISDELHQYFVPGRACRIKDVCIDSAGSISAIFILMLTSKSKKRRRVGELDAKKTVD